MKQKIILASTSPRRKELLRQIGLDFDVAPSDFEEDMSQKLSHKDLAKTLALGKARAAAGKFKNGIVIGADTFVVYGGKRIGKPKDKNDARKMLRTLSGKTMKKYYEISIHSKYYSILGRFLISIRLFPFSFPLSSFPDLLIL